MIQHRPRWSRSLAAALVSLLPLTGALSTSVIAQASGVTVTIDPVGGDGVAGLAILSTAGDGGTNVQILVADAPKDTLAVIHGGTCAAIDPSPVALLGDVSATSQVALPNPFGSLADGAHVLALHAGLDLAAAVGCGAIPAGAVPAGTPGSGSASPSADGGSYTAPTAGFTIAWPAGWERYDVADVAGEERIGLQKGSSSVLISGHRQAGADALACVKDARQELLDRLGAGTLRDLAPLAAEDGSAITVQRPRGRGSDTAT
jgi:hypothetical protein